MSHVTFDTPSDLSIVIDQDDSVIEEPTLLSPRTTGAVLSAQEPSLHDVRQLARPMLPTPHSRTDKHKKEVQRLQDRIDDLEGQAACDEAFKTPPPGYVENSPDRAPRLLIPGADSLWQEAKFVRQMAEGRIAGFAADDDQYADPYIAELYATPKPGQTNDAQPLPAWLRGLLEGPASSWLALRDRIAALPNWGLLAEAERYHCHDEEAERLHTKLCLVKRQVESEELALRQCEGRLEGACLPMAVHHLRHLNTDPRWIRGPSIAEQRILRGHGGRGRPA